ncbi:diguanylate cyclase [Gammaproteobacteria bacterium]
MKNPVFSGFLAPVSPGLLGLFALALLVGSWHFQSILILILTLILVLMAGIATLVFWRQIALHCEQIRHEAEERFRAIFEQAAVGVAVVDCQDGRFLQVNRRYGEIVGRTEAEMLATTFMAITHPEDLAGDQDNLETLRTRTVDRYSREKRYLDKNGAIIWVNLTVSPLLLTDRRLAIAVVEDITPLKAHAAELERAAYFDPMTGVPNRRLLVDRLSQALALTQRSGRLLAICYLDLDGFKPINDQFGHDAGDQLLVEIASRLQSILRSGDTLARLGGDEFVLLLGDLEETSECQHALERILSVISRPMMIGDQAISVSASIGATLYPYDEAEGGVLLQHADHAMYQAKEAGKNRFHFYDPARDQAIRRQQEQFKRLTSALENREFVLYYQPRVRLADAQVTGVEALVHWQHPEQGMLAPEAFLPLLAGTDLERRIGDWAIDATLAQIENWQAAGLNLGVSVPISSKQLQPDFVPALKALLERHSQVPAGCLELEIPESASLSDPSQFTQIVIDCQSLGVGFTLNHFGTGCASLTHLHRLPVKTLKIDPSCVLGMQEDQDHLAIVEGLVNLARTFDRIVVAEGVASLALGKMLLTLGCEQGQGDAIAAPMPAEELPAWLVTWQREMAWRDLSTSLMQQDVSLIVAVIHHRQWLMQLIRAIQNGAVDTLPMVSSQQCRFGLWYHQIGIVRYGHQAAFLAIEPLHERIHQLASKLKTLVREGQLVEARTGLTHLLAQHETLLASLDRLVSEDAPNMSQSHWPFDDEG